MKTIDQNSLRAVAYARYSSDQQRAASIDDQLRNCRKRADAEGWKITATYTDAAMSGSDSNRPQYQAMLAAAKRGEFDILLLDDLSRLTRDSVENEKSIRSLEFGGVRIVSVSDGYDSNSKQRKIHRSFKGLMNEIFLDDLSDRVHRGLAGQAAKKYWCGGRPYGFRLKPILDSSRLDAYGQPVRIGTVLEVDPDQAAIVREIFSRYADGASCLAIARELNGRGVPSPGSTWKRNTRRSSGWMQSAVRGMLKNPLYTGRVRWNATRYLRDPDTGSQKRRARPKSEWVEHYSEALRIIPDVLFDRAQKRTRIVKNNDERLKAGGRVKYLLSGLLVCDVCGAHYVIADARAYACSGHWNGRACANRVRVRRDVIEAAIIRPIHDELLRPERVAQMAQEMQKIFADRMKVYVARDIAIPHELQALNARLERLKERQRMGDADMTADDLQAVIDRAEEKRRELQAAQPEAKQQARILAMLPRAAELYRKQIVLGLEGDPRALAKARIVLRELLGGKIKLSPGDDGSLWAEYAIEPEVLVRVAAGAVPFRADR